MCKWMYEIEQVGGQKYDLRAMREVLVMVRGRMREGKLIKASREVGYE